MIGELGHASLILAFIMACWQAVASPLSSISENHAFTRCIKPLTLCVFALVTISFACLITAYVQSDFTLLSVVKNSHSLKPFWYKITGSWGNHEGSMLLWIWVLSLYGALAAYLPTRDVALREKTLLIIGTITAGFLAFLLITSNPFIRVFPAPQDGTGLNPLLQDIGLILHPPILYLGYVGSAIVFAYSVAAMWQNRLNSQTAAIIQPWALACWAALTAGIGLGAWWAYRELGWGGWWFWDPVENVALLPWLCMTAFIHSNIVLEKRNQLAFLVGFLALLSFSMSLIGTFIVRSGLITSVHAFASASDRGVFLLIMIAAIMLVASLAFGKMRADTSQSSESHYAILSRQGFIVLMSILLLALAGTILLAILYPLILTLLGQSSISVGAPYFEAVFIPLVMPLAALSALAPLMLWDHFRAKHFRSILRFILPPTLIAAGVCFYFIQPKSVIALIALGLAASLIFSMIRFIQKTPPSLRGSATIIGHLGFALLLVSITINAQFKQEIETPMRVGETKTISGHVITLRTVNLGAKDNYIHKTAVINLTGQHGNTYTLKPETRYYPVRGQETTESGIHSIFSRDVYAVIGRISADRENITDALQQNTLKQHNSIATEPIGVKMIIAPFQQLIWLGFIMVIVSGLIAMVAHIKNKYKTNSKPLL